MRDLVVPVGKNAIFRCEAESLANEFPPSLPIWKKNEADLVVIDENCMIKKRSKNELQKPINIVIKLSKYFI